MTINKPVGILGPRNSPESAAIIIACQTVMPAGAAESLSRLLMRPMDWNRAIRVAGRNGVLPLFSWNLLNHFSEHLPADVKRRLIQELRAHTQTNLFLTGKVGELVRMFRENDVEALPFKGPMLSLQVYGNPALRKYGDLDMLVQPRHFERAVQVLKENGYVPVTSVSWLKKTNWYVSRKKDIYFVDQNRSVNLELHWKLSGSHFGLPREMNRLWDRLETVNLAGTPVLALSFNDLLIYLCLHGSRHSWERFSWICDVNELIRSEQHIDWELVFSESKRYGCENVVALGLRLIHDFFGFNAPASIWDKIKSDPMYDEMVAEIRGRLFSGEAKTVNIGERYDYHLRLKERPSDKWKLHFHYITWYMRIILTPNEMDTSVMHFPRFLYPLYYVTRPLRLAYTYFVRSRRDHFEKRVD